MGFQGDGRGCFGLHGWYPASIRGALEKPPKIDMMFDVPLALLMQVREGKARPIAVGSTSRVSTVPDLADR